MMAAGKKPKIFISYSWDSPEHQAWVLELADLIDLRGGEAIVDRKHLKLGGHIKTFMINSINKADLVLLILTPKYREKAEEFKGGAGYEYNIIHDELFKIIQTNEKFIPIIRIGSFEESTTPFLQGFNCVDLRDGNNYGSNLSSLLAQIMESPSVTVSPIITSMKAEMEIEYKDQEALIKEISKKGGMYFEQLFAQDNQAFAKLKVKSTIADWEKEIEAYHKATIEKFNPKKMSLYEEQMEDFRSKVFGKELWTVSAALKTPDPDLARYKKDFKHADASDVFETVSNLLEATSSYVANSASKFNYNEIKEVSDLGMEFLNKENMVLSKVIGYGIRSELLHRYYPAYLSIMTQKSLWAMYFICESANEFIVIEENKFQGKIRVSHNWQYPYDRFTFLMNVIFLELENWVKKYDTNLKAEYRFGYVNMFLSWIYGLHKADAKLLHEWVEN